MYIYIHIHIYIYIYATDERATGHDANDNAPTERTDREGFLFCCKGLLVCCKRLFLCLLHGSSFMERGARAGEREGVSEGGWGGATFEVERREACERRQRGRKRLQTNEPCHLGYEYFGKGRDNVIKGTENAVKGTDDAVKGRGNAMKGMDNAVQHNRYL